MSDQLLALLDGHPILLWPTDRSRYETGFHCAMERYLRYHYGAHGYGMEKAAQKVPLASGDVIHTGIAHGMLYAKDHDQLPPPKVVDDAVQIALDKYQHVLDSRGVIHWSEDSNQQARVLEEQFLLVEGGIRAFLMWRLPEILRDWRIVRVEEEFGSIQLCTCGIGDRLGAWTDHVLRGCEGILIQTRGDAIAEHRRAAGLFSYHELKSTAENNKRFRETYETTMQPYLGTLGAEDTLGIEVGEIFVHGIIKGKYEHEYNPATKDYDGPEFQNSRLVYAWMDDSTVAGTANWAVKYQWRDELNVNHKLPKAFKRTYVGRFGNYQEYLETFADDLRTQVLHTIGPLPRKDHIRQNALIAWKEREIHVRWALFEIADAIDAAEGQWGAPEVQEVVVKHFPPSYDCQRFGGRWACHYIPVCHRAPGWEDPMGLLGYVPRRPHHAPEEVQAVQRGCLAPVAAVESQLED